jgi:hypothetical protein
VRKLLAALFACGLLVGVLALRFLRGDHPEAYSDSPAPLAEPVAESGRDVAQQANRVLASLAKPREAESSVAPRRKTQERPEKQDRLEGFHVSYFNRELLAHEPVKQIYRKLVEKLPRRSGAELIAIYISEAPLRNSQPDFVRFMNALHEDIRARSDEIYEILMEQDAELKKDAFIYQGVLNLAFQLVIPNDRKARLFGNALDLPFEREGESGVTLMSANITNALILMKNSGLSNEEARPYILRGLAANQNHPDSLKEFVIRVKTYYPGVI